MNDGKDARESLRAQAWAERARSTLEQSAAELDAATRSRLNRARQAALTEAGRWRRSTALLWPAALAMASALAVAVVLVRQPETAAGALPVAVEDFDVIAAQDSLELYEDLEFYAWLDAQPADG
jgi:hypothetical protein